MANDGSCVPEHADNFDSLNRFTDWLNHRGRCAPGHRLAVGRLADRVWIAVGGMIVLFVLALSWLAAAVGLLARSAEAANSFTFVLMFIPYEHCVRARPYPADPLRWIAEHQPFTPIVETMRGLWIGAHLHRRGHRPRGLDRDRVLRGHPGRRRHRRILAIPAPHQRLMASIALSPRRVDAVGLYPAAGLGCVWRGAVRCRV